MELLNISSNAPKSDSRLKALLWPTIRHEGDLEHIAEQGFWMCLLVAILSLVLHLLIRDFIFALLEPLFYLMCAVGVRERSLAASVVAFVAYLASALLAQRATGHGFGILTIIILALLLSNVRGIWLASRWGVENALPPVARLNDTILDKLSGRMPQMIWPKVKWLFVVIAAVELAFLTFALLTPIYHNSASLPLH